MPPSDGLLLGFYILLTGIACIPKVALHFAHSQDDETALLQKALAMSMEDAKSGGVAVTDTSISDATADDAELAFASTLTPDPVSLSHLLWRRREKLWSALSRIRTSSKNWWNLMPTRRSKIL